MITQKTIDEIFATAQIEEVVGDFVQLKRRGSNMIGLCPFHNERTPSFAVSPSKNIYKCFGCGRGGNTVQFVMEHEQMSYPEALKYLADKYDIKVEETMMSQEEKVERNERESFLIVNTYAQDFFVQSLHHTDLGKSVGLAYFKKRGYPDSIISSFGLGYAPPGGRAWMDWSKSKGVNPEVSMALGLVTEKGDFFRDRVMFPIHNVAGKIIAFAGRSLREEKRIPKYINSPESVIYDKSKTLYGIHLAKKAMVQEDLCILVEGYTDVISMHQHGVSNVVASSGTSLTEGQIRLIKRFTQNVLILYDGDAAGQKAALRGIDLLLEQDLNVNVALLPENNDPDSFIKKEGVNGFCGFVEVHAKDFILFKSDRLLAESEVNPIKKSVLIKDIVGSIALIPDAIKRSVYLQAVSEQFGVDQDILQQSLGEIRGKKAHQNRVKQRRSEYKEKEDAVLRKVTESESLQSDVPQERDILRILIEQGHNYFPTITEYTVGDYIIANLQDILGNENIFEMQDFIKIINEYKRIKREKGEVRQEDFTQHPDQRISSLAIDLITHPYEYSENWAKRYDIYLNTQESPEHNFRSDCQSGLLRLKMRKLNKLIEENKKRIQRLMQDVNGSHEDEIRMALEVHSRHTYQRNEIAQILNQVVL